MLTNRRYRVVALCLAVSAAAVPLGARQARPVKQYTMEQFLNTTAINGASFSKDESRLLFSSNKSGIWNVYTVAATGGPWTQVTSSTTDSTYAVSWFPADRQPKVRGKI